MKMKSIITALVTTAFLLIAASLSLATNQKIAAGGTVAKIEGNKVTVRDEMGKEMTVDVKDIKNIKVGDKVKIEDSITKSSTEESGMSEKPKKPGYQVSIFIKQRWKTIVFHLCSLKKTLLEPTW